MITWIGLCAGEIWHYLDAHGGQATLGSLLTEIQAPRETILMAVGWLAREGHVRLKGNDLLETALIIELPNDVPMDCTPSG
jgi:hypothetical protein